MENREIFESYYFKRANYIWWQAQNAILPSEAINVWTKSHEDYITFMEEREEILRKCFYAIVKLREMAKEFSPKNTTDQLKAACVDIVIAFEEVVEETRAFSNKLKKLEEEYLSKEDKAK